MCMERPKYVSMCDSIDRVLLGRVSRGESIDDVRQRLVLLLVATHGALEGQLLLESANLATVRFNEVGCNNQK